MNEQLRYSAAARTLHWIIAALVIYNLFSGLFHDALKNMTQLMPLHKAAGLTILVLTVARIVWRFVSPPPPLDASLSPLRKLGAQAVSVGFYALLLILPLTGWAFASAGKYPLSWFGLFDWPKLAVTKDSPLANFTHEAHELTGWVMLVLVIVHVSAALHHHFILKDKVLRRML